jgi:hypothetical protein
MTILITDTSREEGRASITMTNGKQSVYIARSQTTGLVRVCNMNASNKVWRKMGKTFSSIDAAIAAYKSSFMKDALAIAREYV